MESQDPKAFAAMMERLVQQGKIVKGQCRFCGVTLYGADKGSPVDGPCNRCRERTTLTV